jgi:hypothetical protein
LTASSRRAGPASRSGPPRFADRRFAGGSDGKLYDLLARLRRPIGLGFKLDGSRPRCDPEDLLLSQSLRGFAYLKLRDRTQNRPFQLGESWIVGGKVLVLFEPF